MKKRMLITTIVMVLVVAIALTTSSLAWFTMSAQVSISEVSFGAIAYSGADLKVSDLARNGFSNYAQIGTAAQQMDPIQGNPGVADIVFPAEGYDDIAFQTGTFYKAADVTTTAVGAETEHQKVKLVESNTGDPAGYFVGGFNVLNNGTRASTVTFNAKLNVGAVTITDPDGTPNSGDETYSYTAVDKDKALAGGMRVAVFTRTWTATLSGSTFTYTDSATVTREGIWGLAAYKVTWGANNWSVANSGGVNNNLYVPAPIAGVYSKNINLATGATDPAVGVQDAFWVDEDATSYEEDFGDANASATNYGTVLGIATTVGAHTFTPVAQKTIAGIDEGTYSGIEVIVVAWLDGWDDESVPAAGGGTVSLTFGLAGATA